MALVLVQPVANFYGYHPHKIDPKSRLTIPAAYRRMIAYRNATNIRHGLLDDSFSIQDDGISFSGELIFKFDRLLENGRKKITLGKLEGLLNLTEINHDVGVGMTQGDEIRCYALSDLAKITDKGSAFKYFNRFKMDVAGRVQLDTFMQQILKPGDEISLYGMGEYFVIKK